MIKYYQNKETGTLVGLTNDGRVIEFEEVKSGVIVDAQKDLESVGGG